MPKIQLAIDLELPLDLTTEAIAILARRRAGKSYTARRVVEQLLKANAQVVIVDLPFRRSAVARLFARRSPTAIFGRVRPVVIDAVDRMPTGRSRPHVFKERLEAVAPAIADRDAASSPRRVIRTARVEAPILEALPRVVFDGAAAAVRTIGSRRPLALQAAARLDLFAEMVLAHACFIPAHAPAHPEAMPRAWLRRFAQHRQAPVHLSAEVYQPRSHTPIVLPAHATCGGM